MPQFTIELSENVSALLEKKATEAGITPEEFAAKLIVAGLSRELRLQTLMNAIRAKASELEQLLASRCGGPFSEMVDLLDLRNRVVAVAWPKENTSKEKVRRWLHRDLEQGDLSTYAATFANAEEFKSALVLFPSVLDSLHLRPEFSHPFPTSNPILQSIRFASLSHKQDAALFFEPSPEGDGIRVLHLMSIRY